MPTLDADTIRARLTELEGWEFTGRELLRQFGFDTFRDAIDFVVRVADLADEADHHPDIHNSYNRVMISLTSHDVGGVSERDLSMARKIDAVVDV